MVWNLDSDIKKLLSLRLFSVVANSISPFATLFFSLTYGFDSNTIAKVVAAFALCYLFGNVTAGLVINRFQPQKLLIISFACSSLCMMGTQFFGELATIILFLLLAVFFNGLVTPVFSVVVSNAVTEANRTTYFGYLHLASNLGAAIVFTLGGFLLERSGLLLIALSVAANTVALIISIVIRFPTVQAIDATDKDSLVQPKRMFSRGVLVSLALFFVVSILDSQREYQLPLWLNSEFVESAAFIFGAMGLANAFVVMLFTQILIRATKEINALVNICLACIFYGIGFGVYSVSSNEVVIFLSVAVWTAGEILAITYITSLISSEAPPKIQGWLYSGIPVLLAISKSLSVIISARLLTELGFSLTWMIYGVIGTLVGSLAIIFFHRSSQARPNLLND